MNILERTILMKALTDLVDAEKKATDAEAKALFEPGDRKAVRYAGEKVGTITVSEPKPAWRVTDRRAFTAWVQANHPDAVVAEPVVVPGWEKDLLADPVDPATGEIPDGVELKTGSPSWIVKAAPGAIHALAPGIVRALEIES
mgnify:FL=1|jgi:hypothetical protein